MPHNYDTAHIRHIFFDLHGTLVDGGKLHPCYALNMGVVLAQRYGLTPQMWAAANSQIMRDWDSYYADLDLAGEDGMAHYYEGLFRTTRALFRLTKISEPPHDELIALSRELPNRVTWTCDALYADVKAVIERLGVHGYHLHVTTHALERQARGLLNGGGILPHFKGMIIGADTLERWDKDIPYFTEAVRRANTQPTCCLVVDDVPDYLYAAKQIGMQTVYITRKPRSTHPTPLALHEFSDYQVDNLQPLIAILKLG